jgi:hypothetical protein
VYNVPAYMVHGKGVSEGADAAAKHVPR